MSAGAVILSVGLLSSASVVADTAADVAQAASPSAQRQFPPRRVTLNVQIRLNGAPLGDVNVEAGPAGDANVDGQQLLVLLQPVVTESVLADLRLRIGDQAMVSIEGLSTEAFRISFDLASLAVVIEIPVDARAAREFSIVEQYAVDPASLTPPEEYSAGVTFSVGTTIEHGGDEASVFDEEYASLAEGFVNFGGKDGYYLTFLAGLNGDDGPVRQRTTLFRDDVDRAIRYAAGDLDPQGFGAYFNPLSLLGVGVERLYQEIQPYRNLRPAGRGSAAIARPSRVDIMVNGRLFRTVDLAPGQYNLRDFPFLNGVNDVQLVVRDDTGRIETIGLSFFSDTELLNPGLSLFSAALGIRRDRFGDTIDSTYGDELTFTGFYQRGFSDRLTVGGALQVDRENILLSGQTVVGTPVGLFGVEAALDHGVGEDLETAVLASYRLRGESPTGRFASASVDVQYRSAHFSPLQLRGVFENRFSFDVNARYQTAIGYSTYATFGAGYSVGRGTQPDQRTLTAGASRRFGRITASLDYSYRDATPRPDHQASVSITVPFNSGQSVRARYDTDRSRVSADYTRVGLEELGQVNARAFVGRDDRGTDIGGDLEYFSNRFRAVARHASQETFGATRHRTDLGVNFGVGYAGGKWALGRDAGRGFTIVAAHPTLGEAPVLVSDSYSTGTTARTGTLGPALVPTRRAYSLSSIEATVAEAPLGYDIGPGRIDILPGAASGYLFVVGSAASNTVIGRVVDETGSPAQFVVGTLIPISGAEAQPAPFFTNRTGRLVAQRVAPGRYRVIVEGRTQPLGEIVVPSNPDGPVDVGQFTLRGVKR